LKHLNYERAKRFFRSGEYALAAELLDEIVREQPLGLDIVEAHFLLAECFYKLDSQREFVTVVNEMVDLFPESDLTGFILLRLGQIYIEQDRVEDAQEVYRVVLSTYQYRPLQIQAKKNLEVIRL
jgi:TolA-binding protein